MTDAEGNIGEPAEQACLDDPPVDTETQKQDFANFSEDVMRIRESMPERRRLAVAKEMRLKKITIQLREEGYSDSQINKIFQFNPDKELFDDIVKKYDESGKLDPDVSYMN